MPSCRRRRSVRRSSGGGRLRRRRFSPRRARIWPGGGFCPSTCRRRIRSVRWCSSSRRSVRRRTRLRAFRRRRRWSRGWRSSRCRGGRGVRFVRVSRGVGFVGVFRGVGFVRVFGVVGFGRGFGAFGFVGGARGGGGRLWSRFRRWSPSLRCRRSCRGLRRGHRRQGGDVDRVELIDPGAIWALVIVPFLILFAVIVSFFNLPPPIDLLTIVLPLILRTGVGRAAQGDEEGDHGDDIAEGEVSEEAHGSSIGPSPPRLDPERFLPRAAGSSPPAGRRERQHHQPDPEDDLVDPLEGAFDLVDPVAQVADPGDDRQRQPDRAEGKVATAKRRRPPRRKPSPSSAKAGSCRRFRPRWRPSGRGRAGPPSASRPLPALRRS